MEESCQRALLTKYILIRHIKQSQEALASNLPGMESILQKELIEVTEVLLVVNGRTNTVH